MNNQSKIQVSKIRNIGNALVIKKVGENNSFFLTSPDSIIITTQDFSALLCYLVRKKFISPKVLEGILEDYYSSENW